MSMSFYILSIPTLPSTCYHLHMLFGFNYSPGGEHAQDARSAPQQPIIFPQNELAYVPWFVIELADPAVLSFSSPTTAHLPLNA